MKTTRCGRIAGILIVAAVLGLEGCASTATREAMSVGTRATKSYPYSVSVQTRGGTETSAMTGSTISNEELKAALESSIVESKLFKNIAQGLQAIADLGARDADARSERAQASAPAPAAVTYPRELSGQDIAAHFASYPSIEAKQGEGKPGRLAPFTLRINRDRTVDRSCPKCFKPSASGSIVFKQDDALVCFDWGRVPYPASGCFKVV